MRRSTLKALLPRLPVGLPELASIAAVSGVLIAIVPAIARTELQVQDGAADVQVTATDESVASILAALSAPFKLRYTTSVSLDARVTGIYAGSLRQVISRLLDGYSYFVHTEGEATVLVVLGRRGERAIAPPPPAAKGANDFAAKWR
ncbi:MAG: hypothetical protein ACJ8F3_21085 [Xanthobacteraceae bacterium]